MKKAQRPPSLGILFHQLTDFLIYDSGWYATESAFFLNIERAARTDVQHIDADSQFYRKIREGDLDRKTTERWAAGVLSNSVAAELIEEAEEYQGGIPGEWLKLDRAINGFRRGCPEGEIQEYFNYVCALCQVDRALLEWRDPSPQQVLNVWVEISKWLLIQFDATDPEGMALEYKVGRVLHWTALLELYLRVSKPDISEALEAGPRGTMLDPFLPRLDAKRNLTLSVELYMDNLMHKWRPDGCKKVDFYRAIARTRQNADNIDPMIDSIKQADKRLRKGKKPLTISWVEENLGDLQDINSSEDFDTTYHVIPFINMLNYIQRTLVKEGVSQDQIIELFGRYSEHRKAVDERYVNFKRSGVAHHTV